jgi:hypothetical protein
VVPENGEFDDTTANAVRHFRQQGGLGDGAGVDAHVWAALTGGGAAEPSAAGSGGGQHADAAAAHHGGGHRVAPQSGNGPTGLLNDASIDSYVSHTYGATVSSMSADDRAQALMQAVNEILHQGGAPDVHYVFGLSGDGNYGAFDAEQWTMELNQHYFDSTGTDANQLQHDYREALLTVYHEARHAEQAFQMARERAGLGANVDQIIQAMAQSPHHAPVPARWVVELAVQDPILQCDHTQYLTEEWYTSMYGTGADHRSEVLTHPNSSDFNQQYHALPEEADAWNADDRTGERYNQYGRH